MDKYKIAASHFALPDEQKTGLGPLCNVQGSFDQCGLSHPRENTGSDKPNEEKSSNRVPVADHRLMQEGRVEGSR